MSKTLSTLDVFEEMRAVLVAAQEERPLRRDWVETRGGREIAWHIHELDVMTKAVNAARAQAGKPPVSERDIAMAEHQACGHSDYTRKWAYGCAELVAKP